MKSLSIAMVVSICFLAAIGQQAVGKSAANGDHAEKAWIKQSNDYTNMLLSVGLEHSPEQGSAQGMAAFDERISDPSRADEAAERRELEAALTKIKAARRTVRDKNVQEDIDILQKNFNLQFRVQDFGLAHEVPFYNASSQIFQGLRGLLDDQVPARRRVAALVRLRKYAGVEVGYKPFTEGLKAREAEQIAKPGVIFPSKEEVETELGRNANYAEGIASLFKKYNLTGWEPAYEQLKAQLADYDTWIKANILPKTRTDFRLPPEKYALAFEGYGIDISPAQIAEMAHAAFVQYQIEMAPLAAQVAKANGYSSSDYRAVIAELKKKQITGAAILPFYETRLHEIEKIIVTKNLVTLPSRPAIIRLATPAETAQVPAPHMVPPPFLHNTGQRGEFVLPLNIPSATGGVEDKYDDFTFDAVAWTLTAHEARPGHELQFDSMVEHGVSLARSLFAFNSTNAEGWGLYAEYVMQPYEPVEGQLLTLQLRLLRAARAFLDPELQSGAVTEAQAYSVLEKDVMLSHAFAKEEVERFTFRSPGQANSYFYGYTRLLSLRKETEAALGKQFDQKKFHDFILGQGLLPPDLMRTAVLEEFIPSQRLTPAAQCALCLYGPDNMAFDAAGNLYLVDTDHKSRSRVLKLSSHGRVLADWQVFATVPGHSNGPDGIAVDGEGNILVNDRGLAQVLKLSPTGEVLGKFTGFTAGAFDEGGHVAVGKDGNIYVVAAVSNLMQKYSPRGKLIARWHRDKGPGLDQWIQPETISVGNNGDLVIVDFGNHRIMTISSTGHTIRAFDGIPNEPLKLASISGAVVGPDGNIYVADYQLNRIQEFDPNGRLLATIGNTPGNTLFEVAPNSIAVDQSGNLCATDGLSVVKFSREGKLLARWR